MARLRALCCTRCRRRVRQPLDRRSGATLCRHGSGCRQSRGHYCRPRNRYIVRYGQATARWEGRHLQIDDEGTCQLGGRRLEDGHRLNGVLSGVEREGVGGHCNGEGVEEVRQDEGAFYTESRSPWRSCRSRRPSAQPGCSGCSTWESVFADGGGPKQLILMTEFS